MKNQGIEHCSRTTKEEVPAFLHPRMEERYATAARELIEKISLTLEARKINGNLAAETTIIILE